MSDVPEAARGVVACQRVELQVKADLLVQLPGVQLRTQPGAQPIAKGGKERHTASDQEPFMTPEMAAITPGLSQT